MALNTYNQHWPNLTGNELADQLTIECWYFRMGVEGEAGCLGKYAHFKNIVDLLWNNPALKSPKRFVWHSWAEWIFQTLCKWKFVAISGAASAGKSDPIALWLLVNFIANHTHCKCLMMSTTIAAAKNKIWKTFLEYWDALPPGMPGKLVRQQSLVRGTNYQCTGFSESSGIQLLASGEGMESESLDKLIGIKAPKTDGPDGQEGVLIMAIDEMTGCSPVILQAAKDNLIANKNFQLIGIANFNSPFDSFGELFKPKCGYENLKENVYEFETELGYALILDAERSPLILEGRIDCTWMQTQEELDERKRRDGANSLSYYRFAKGRPSPKGAEESIYDSAEIIRTGSLGNAMWCMERPVPCAFMDPMRSGFGDLAVASFGLLGFSNRGVQTLQLTEQSVVQVDVTDRETPVSFQLMKNFRAECEKRKILPRHAGIDSTNSELIDICHVHWSREILGIQSGGLAPAAPVSNVNRKNACDVFANMASFIWYAAKPFFRGGQIRGISSALAKEICSRQQAAIKRGDETKKIKIEGKREYRKRNKGKSPDFSDSFLGLIGLAKQRMGFKPVEKPAQEERPEMAIAQGAVKFPLASQNRQKFALPSFKQEKASDNNPFGRGGRTVLRVDRLEYD